MIEPTLASDPCGICLVGEAPGEQEEKVGSPFIGPSGQELTKILAEGGIDRSRCDLTNVFMERPPNNDLDVWCVNTKEWRTLGSHGKQFARGKFIRPEYLHHVEKLRLFLTNRRPRLIIALGGTATWALLGTGAISSIRGTVAPNQLCGGKVLATFHPAYILRQWSDRPVMVADMFKAKKELEFPEIRRPQRTVEIAESEADFMLFEQSLAHAQILAIDIETAKGQITCIGFSHSPRKAFVVPICSTTRANRSYWPTLELEVMALTYVRRWLGHKVPKLLQNGIYDIHYLWRVWHMPVKNVAHDTMLRHHSLMPEFRKSLGHLGSLYTTEAPWKLMRKHKPDLEKRDE